MEDIHKVKLCERFKAATSFGMISPEVRVGVNFRFQREREKTRGKIESPLEMAHSILPRQAVQRVGLDQRSG